MSDPKTTETPELTPDQQLFALLKEVSKSLTDGLESPGLLEPDWSRHDRALVWRIDQVIAGFEERRQRCFPEEKQDDPVL